MPNFVLTKTRFFEGVWEGIVTVRDGDESDPAIEVLHLGKTLEGVSVDPDENASDRWNLRISVPATLLSDGVHVFVIQETRSVEKLGAITIVAGEPLEDDIRAEVELLRAELDLMKQAFRRHCLETD